MKIAWKKSEGNENMKPHTWLLGSLIVLCQLVMTTHSDAAPWDETPCMEIDLVPAAHSLRSIAESSGGKLLVLLQCGRANPGANTGAFIVGSEVERVLEKGVSEVHWINRELVLAERLIPALPPRWEFELVGVPRPWTTPFPMVGLKKMRSVSVNSEGTEIAGLIVGPSGGDFLAVFQLDGFTATRTPVELPPAFQDESWGSVAFDKQSNRVAVAPMLYDASVMSQVSRTFLMNRNSGAVKPLQLSQSRPLFFMDDKIFVIDGRGAMAGCDVESGACNTYFSFASEKKRVEGAVAVGHGQAVVLIRDIPRDPFDIRATEVVLVDLASKTVRSRSALAEGLRIRSVDWMPN